MAVSENGKGRPVPERFRTWASADFATWTDKGGVPSEILDDRLDAPAPSRPIFGTPRR